ncbi:methylamine utilization protein [Photobacterium marinum]|uniref:Methylamine utilization protein n=1 Tax=Photobacterium marinum TaxID=1056511 RepID=L8JHB2_9GAMM|nr:cytochrome c peroxidase [Photobacterium marinum]ELR66914.1 methylamine utilization protein [Photobacterium marinum]
MPTANKIILCLSLFIGVTFVYVVLYNQKTSTVSLTETELAIINNLRLPPRNIVQDDSNKLLHNPKAEILGKFLFFDTGLSRSKQIACVSCHQPEHYFSLPSDSEITLDKQVPTLLGVASFSWFMMDGRADSLWAQALLPLENHIEHGGTRTQYVQHVLSRYPELYQEVFGGFPYELISVDLPAQASPLSQYQQEQQTWQQIPPHIQQAINRVFSNIGKLLAAYQATLWPAESRFDHFVDQINTATNRTIGEAISLLTSDEVAGLKLFISDQGKCLRCHNGPLLTNGDFQATTVPTPHPSAEKGRLKGIELAVADPFNCLGIFSDSNPSECKELIYSKRHGDELDSATKVPSLRNIGKTAPYMHSGQLTTLNEVLHYYNRAATPFGAHSDLEPLKLLPYQLNQLEAFLLTLTEYDSPIQQQQETSAATK